MQPFLRLAARAPRARQLPLPLASRQPARFAHQSYGNEQSGMEQGTHEKNPKSDMEHPGPEAPADKGTNKPQSSSSSDESSHKAQPAIHRPKSAAEKEDPDVKKHNEEMEQRHERSVNQLSEKDNKVDKQFWQGDVGVPKDKE